MTKAIVYTIQDQADFNNTLHTFVALNEVEGDRAMSQWLKHFKAKETEQEYKDAIVCEKDFVEFVR